eukprot:Plantae.Rhodophyta-Rhodochaete_pulchella.ctg7201.p1 GENE.Plantae.Rhodophyta-Rhodochaete_pulchella.ctg7201~~Plantae.Rhodophyta-Rhodochaete_pulchella.ctg7201.p1  ORF type:complete len:158 (-),score=5.80 Plantae.Rhodophyta-Rhodochaete_pulchella.ctg7201:64-537(-)
MGRWTWGRARGWHYRHPSPPYCGERIGNGQGMCRLGRKTVPEPFQRVISYRTWLPFGGERRALGEARSDGGIRTCPRRAAVVRARNDRYVLETLSYNMDGTFGMFLLSNGNLREEQLDLYINGVVCGATTSQATTLQPSHRVLLLPCLDSREDERWM